MDHDQFMTYINSFFGQPEEAWQVQEALDDSQGVILIQIDGNNVDMEVLRRIHTRIEEMLIEEVGEW